MTAACRNLISRTLPIAHAGDGAAGQEGSSPSGAGAASVRSRRRSFAGGKEEISRLSLTAWPRRRIARILINRGERQTKSGQYRRGWACFWLALKFTPSDVGTWSRSFMARMAIGDFRGALRDIDVALALSPHDLNLVVQHAEAAEALEMWAAAVADYEVVMRARAGRADMRAKQAGMYAAWGDGLARAGQLDRRSSAMPRRCKSSPNDIAVLARCVNVKIELGDGAGALADIDRALALAPHEANLLAQRISLVEAMKLQGADARGSLTAAVRRQNCATRCSSPGAERRNAGRRRCSARQYRPPACGSRQDEHRRPGRNVRRRENRDSEIVAADAGAILVDIEVELVVDAGRNPDAGYGSPEDAERPRLVREPSAALQGLVEPASRRPAICGRIGSPGIQAMLRRRRAGDVPGA